ncbi:MAG: hypothetical protein FJ297_00855 [Planctomycetes bacterium]|nr:hypothetical protein [Planctomycetota bacterium]
MATVQDCLCSVRARMDVEPGFRCEIESALSSGGIDAAVEVARRNGIEVPNDWRSHSNELSDTELELVTAGKAFYGLAGAIGTGIGGLLGG